MKQTELFWPKILQFFKTAVLTFGMDISIDDNGQRLFLDGILMDIMLDWIYKHWYFYFSISSCTQKAFETDLMLGLLPDLSEQDMDSFLPEVAPHIKPKTMCLLSCEAGFDIFAKKWNIPVKGSLKNFKGKRAKLWGCRLKKGSPLER